MTYNTTASLAKLVCTDYMEFGKCHYRFRQISFSKDVSNYLDVKLKVFKKDDNKEIRLVKNLTMGEAEFSQFMQLRNELVLAAQNFAGEKKLSQVLIPTLSKDVVKQLKLAHKLVDILDRANRVIWVTLLWYSLDRPEICYAQVPLFARGKKDQNFHQNVYVNFKLEELFHLLDVMISVYDKKTAMEPIWNVLAKVFAPIYSLLFFFLFESVWVGILKTIETSFSS